MTTAARKAEADRVELVYYWALNQLGHAMQHDALDLWSEVPANASAGRSSSWLVKIIELLFGFRTEAHALAISYYRLVRALRTGFTVANDSELEGDLASLNQLRDDFETIVDHIDLETSDVSHPHSPEDVDIPEPDLELGDDEDSIEIEYIGDLDSLVDASNEAALEEAGIDLDALGTQNFLDMIADLDPKSDTYDADVKAAHDSAGERGAAAAMRIMLNASRGLVYDLADTDLRVIGWARYSQTGHPCGWCALFISRGAVYKSASSASAQKRDGSRNTDLLTGQAATETDKYHDFCHCVAVPVFDQAQFDTSQLFDKNRELAALYAELKKISPQKRIELYGTPDLLAIFRQIMRARKATAALEAA